MLTKANLLLTQQKYSEDKMLALIGGNKTLATKLDEYAQNLINALENGLYSTSPVALWLAPPRTEVTPPAATPVEPEKPNSP